MTDETDLFGDPCRLPSGRRGRPAHRFSQKIANKVMMLEALGWSNERIAHAIHCSLPTLRKYYFSELKRRDIQRDRLDAWRFEKVVEQADKGNVGAQRLLNQMVEKNDMMLAAARMRARPEEAPEEKLGKKEMARRKAADLAEGGDTGIWGSDLRPGNYH